VPLPAPVNIAEEATRAALLGTGQASGPGLEFLGDGLEPQRDQHLDHGHPGVHVVRIRLLSERLQAHVFHPALLGDSD